MRAARRWWWRGGGGRSIRASVVCWGVGRGERQDETRVWRRFRCIAPTFHGAHAGPDILFVLQPTGRRTFAVLNQRLSSY
jgi:hypothetical protein